MNCGTGIQYARSNNYPNGSYFTGSSQRFGSLRIIFGLQKKQYNASIISYATTDKYDQGDPALWLEAKFGYTLPLFK